MGRRAVLTVLALMALAGSAHAQDLSPRQIYDRGAAEYDAHDYAKAAVDFARADDLAPNEVTLTYALEAAVRAHNAALVMELVTRVEKRFASGNKLHARAQEARKTFAHEVGQLVVKCPAPITFCKATVDAELVTIGAATYLAPGAHAVHIAADGVESDQSVQVDAEKSVDVAPPVATPPPQPVTPPPPAPVVVAPQPLPPSPPPPPPKSEKLSPTWFWIAGGATAVLGGVSIWSGVDTLSKHDTFNGAETTKTQRDGQSAQRRTNILFAATAVGAIGTTVLGLFFVGWSPAGPTVTASAKF